MQHSVSMLGATLATVSMLGMTWAQTPDAAPKAPGQSTPSTLEATDPASADGKRVAVDTKRAESAKREKGLASGRNFGDSLRKSERGSLSATEWCIDAFDAARLDRASSRGNSGRRARAYTPTEATIKYRLYGRWIDLWSGRLSDRPFDILARLEREALATVPSLGQEATLELLDRLAISAGVDRSAAQILLVQARQLSLTGDPADVARARRIHERIQSHFAGTPEAHRAARASWRGEHLSIGQTAPNFITRDHAGNEIRLSDFRGQVVVVHFWRRDAGREAEEQSLIELRDLVQRHWDTPFALIGVNGDSDRDIHRVRWIEHGVVWHEAFEPMSAMGARAAWKVDNWPSTFILDVDGVVHGITRPGSPIGRLVNPLVTRHVASLQDASDPDSQGAH